MNMVMVSGLDSWLATLKDYYQERTCLGILFQDLRWTRIIKMLDSVIESWPSGKDKDFTISQQPTSLIKLMWLIRLHSGTLKVYGHISTIRMVKLPREQLLGCNMEAKSLNQLNLMSHILILLTSNLNYPEKILPTPVSMDNLPMWTSEWMLEPLLMKKTKKV